MKLKTTVALFLLSVAELFGADTSQRQAPQIVVPTQFHGPAAAGSADVARWWKKFNDPQLDRLIERALRSNLDLQIAEARLREVRANRIVAASDLYPHLGVSGSLTRAQNNLGSAFGPSSGSGGTTNIFVGSQAANFGTTGFDASWELDVFGAKRANVRAAVADLAGADDARRNVLVSLLAELARNYMEIRTSQRHIGIADSRIQAQQQTLELTRRRFDAGQAGMLDVTRAEAESASVKAEMPPLKVALQQSMHRVSVLLGEEPGALNSELAEVQAIPVTPLSIPAGVPSELLLRRPDVRQARDEVAAATARIGIAKADLFPKLSLTGSFGGAGTVGESRGLALGFSRFFSFGPTVSLPIFDGGRLRANVKIQESRQQQTVIRYHQVVLQSLEEVENALVACAREQERQQALVAATEASKKAVDLAKQLYSHGVGDFLSVLEAQESLYSTEDQLVRSQRNAATNLIGLYKALGGGWE
jgi:NodT family efflux transporter outer membrane factor (OMF) lipoprotein